MRKGKTLFKWLLFLVILVLAFTVVCHVVERKESVRKYADLYAAGRADVLFIGSSHVINGINPVQLFDEYGIAGYNLGGHGSILPAAYYELLCALDIFSPRLVVVDGYMMERDYHYLDQMTEEYDDEERASAVSQLHLNMDVFPLSRNKIYAVRDLIADRSLQMEFLFPFILYHNRWSSLTSDDFLDGAHSPETNRLLGAEIRTRVEYRTAPHPDGDDELTDEIHLGESYLQMILALCRERGIQPAITFLPCNSTALDRQTAARLHALSEAECVPYLDLLTEEAADFRTDFNDEGHLNLLGMTKTTRRVGRFISEECPVPDRRGDKAYRLWMDRAEQFDTQKGKMLAEAKSLSEALVVLGSDRELGDAVLYLSGTGAAIGDPAVRNLLDALVPENGLRKAAAAGEPALFILPADASGSVDLSGYQVTDWMGTRLGELEAIQVENFTGVYLDHDESENLLDMEENRLTDAQLVVLPADGSDKNRLLFNYDP